MKARPILFAAPMVNALLDGRKTQTRRVVKPQPSGKDGSTVSFGAIGEDTNILREIEVNGYSQIMESKCPYGKIGDLAYVRETFAEWDDGLVYRAAHPVLDGVTKWKPSIHMPKWASRITLEITDVRVERLNDISQGAAKSEGVLKEYADGVANYKNYEDTNGGWFLWPEDSFRSLWQSINGKDSWQENPWVWVLEFKVHKCNVLEMAA